MEPDTPFEVMPWTPFLGADVRGIDLVTDFNETVREAILDTLGRYHVVAVRGQSVTPESLHRIARSFGPYADNPVHVPVEGFADIVKFARDADETGPVIGENWHMDLAWQERPPGITMLYGEVIPPVGGDTMFASLELAYEALSPGMKALVRDLKGVHSAEGVFAGNARHRHLRVKEAPDGIEGFETLHPIVCAHPRTGRPYLMVTSAMRRFDGFSAAESRPIIDFLVSVATRPEHSCRLRWSQGTLLFWENPCLLHTAINDYSGHRRVMYRTLVEGHRPH